MGNSVAAQPPSRQETKSGGPTPIRTPSMKFLKIAVIGTPGSGKTTFCQQLARPEGDGDGGIPNPGQGEPIQIFTIRFRGCQLFDIRDPNLWGTSCQDKDAVIFLSAWYEEGVDLQLHKAKLCTKGVFQAIQTKTDYNNGKKTDTAINCLQRKECVRILENVVKKISNSKVLVDINEEPIFHPRDEAQKLCDCSIS